MRSRALIVLATLGAALCAASAAGARGESGIELSDGSGRAVLQMRGAVLGTVGRGRVSVKVLGGGATQVVLEGCRTRRTMPDATLVCTGDDIRFRVFRGTWRVAIDGDGINASAVGKGTIGLRGIGTYSLGGAPAEPWPATSSTIRLGGGRAVGGTRP